MSVDSASISQNLTATTGLVSHVELTVAGYADVAIQLEATFVGTAQFEGTVDNTTWAALTMHPSGSPGTNVTSATAPGVWLGSCGGLYAVRVRCSAFTSGVIATTISAAQSTVQAVSVVAGDALAGTGQLSDPLDVQVDNVSIRVNGSNQLEVVSTLAAASYAIGITIDGAGSAITTGTKGFVQVPQSGTITGVTVLSTDASVTSGSIVVDIWKDTFAHYPPTIADTITASAKPTLSSATSSQDTTLTGWTTSVTAGDVIGFHVDSVTTLTRVTLILTVAF